MKQIKNGHLLFSGSLAATLLLSGTGSLLAETPFHSGTHNTHISIRPVYDLRADQESEYSSVVEANDLQEDLLAGSVAKADLLEQGFSEAQVRKIFQSAPKFM